MDYISKEDLRRLARTMDTNEYGKYLLRLLEEDIPFNLRSL
jgi:hypothetical protein